MLCLTVLHVRYPGHRWLATAKCSLADLSLQAQFVLTDSLCTQVKQTTLLEHSRASYLVHSDSSLVLKVALSQADLPHSLITLLILYLCQF